MQQCVFQNIWKILLWHYWVTSNFKWKIFSNFVPFSESPSFNSRIMHCKYLRSPSAITVVGMLDNRNILSIMHRMISSWLNALLILGFRRIYIAQAFPTNPKIIKTVDMTPVNQNFHSIRLWKREYFGLGKISNYIYSSYGTVVRDFESEAKTRCNFQFQ